MIKYYKVSEDLLRELLYNEAILSNIECSLPTGLEGFEEDLSPDDIDLSDYPVAE